MADGPFSDAGNEILSHLVVDIGFEQRHPHLAERLLYVGLGELSLAPQVFEYLLKFVGKIIEHFPRRSSYEIVPHVPPGHPETMKRPVGWVERSATHQVFSNSRVG